VVERRCEPIWYALATAPVLTSTQWRAAVGHASDSMGDAQLLRLLFERPDRTEDDRLWLLDTVAEFQLRDVLCSPAATIEHARRAVARCEKAKPLSPAHDSAVDWAVTGLSWNPRLGEDPALLEFTVGLIERLSVGETVSIIVRWPGHPPAEPLLWALLSRAVHLPEPHRNSWDKYPDEPVGGQYAHLWTLLRLVPTDLQVQAARRWPRLQAVLLEHGDDLDPVVLQACTPVLSDPNLGGPGPISAAGRLATLRRWSDRHPGLGDAAAAACRTAGLDAARALSDPKRWDDDLVDELVLFTNDPKTLTAAVEQIVSTTEIFSAVGEGVETFHGRTDVGGLGRRALTVLAGSPHTPDDVLLRVLSAAPGRFAEDLLELRPHLAEPLRLEILSRTGVYGGRDRFEEPIVVPGDDELAATGNPAGVLTSLLMQLPTASRAQAARLAAQLLHSRYADATVLAALPAAVVRQSPWHADLAAQMLAEACGDDPARWALASQVFVSRVTYGGYLAELRDYTPMRPGKGLAGYRLCQECQLITPHRWPAKNKEQRMSHEHDGWMTCALCSRNVPPARLPAADAALPCPNCATTIDYPAGAAVLQCPSCGRHFAAPDLPEDLRPRLSGVLGEQQRISDKVDELRTRISQFLGDPGDPGDLDDLAEFVEDRPVPLGPDGTPTVRRARPPRKFAGAFDLTPPPAEWLSHDQPAQQFRTALRTALHRHTTATSRDAALRRYGLGRSRRPVPAADIARQAGVTTATVTRWIRDAVGMVSAAARTMRYPEMRAHLSAGDKAAIIAAHLADQALGNLDPTDPATCRQIADLLTAALPGVDVDAGVRLLLHLSSCDTDLTPAAIHALIRGVKHAS
jgi:hypothetical protein